MIRAIVSATVVVLAAGAAGGERPFPAQSAVRLRFHHLHYRAADPGHVLGEAAERLGGDRIIAPGLGVGIRVGRQYVLIDRASAPPRNSRGTRQPARVYADARRWLTSQGLDVEPVTLADTSVASPLADASFDHLAFASDDIDAVLKVIPHKPVSRTDEAARFRLPAGDMIEIVRDADRPDAYWCPMHPDVRSPTEGTCPLCRMALVPIPPPRVGEYQLDVDWIRAGTRDAAAGARLTVRDPATSDVVRDFLDVHERRFHLFVISRDLERFAHVHPSSTREGTFELVQPFDRGVYMFIADFLPAAGTPQLVQRTLATPDYDGPLFTLPPSLRMLPSEHMAAGLRIRLDAGTIAPRRPARLRFTVFDAATGAPITDLEPYLGAAGHLLIVDGEATIAIHGHPEGPPTAGPEVTFVPVLPAPGRYKLWVQFQRKGEVVTAPFVIEAKE